MHLVVMAAGRCGEAAARQHCQGSRRPTRVVGGATQRLVARRSGSSVRCLLAGNISP